jgi:hypothetical protein
MGGTEVQTQTTGPVERAPYIAPGHLRPATGRMRVLPPGDLRELLAIPVEAGRPDTFAVARVDARTRELLEALVDRPVGLVRTATEAIECSLARNRGSSQTLGRENRRRNRRVSVMVELRCALEPRPEEGGQPRARLGGQVVEVSRCGVRALIEVPPGNGVPLTAGSGFELGIYLPGLRSLEVVHLSGTVRWSRARDASVELGGATRPASLVDRCRLERLLVRLLRIEAARGVPTPEAVAELRRGVLGTSV